LARILVIDDDVVMRTTAVLMLRTNALHQTMELSSGKDAVQAAIEFSPDLILLDLFMPEIDGISVLAMLKSNPETEAIPVCLVTSPTPESKSGFLADLGLKHTIFKPYELLHFNASISEILESTN
jgi:CheY-like chemotaxis protein